MIEQRSKPELAPLLAMSTVNLNALVTALSRAGWPVSGVRGFDAAAERLAGIGSSAAIVDLRDDPQLGLGAIRALSEHARILAIVPGRDVKWIEAAIDAGTTHYLTSPFPQVELAQAVRLIADAPKPADRAPVPDEVLEGVEATRAIDRRLREGRVSALLIAATRCENVNAAYGREVGDALLGAVAQRITATVRSADPTAAVARVAGAEFAVLVAAGRGAALAEQICARIDRPFMVAGQIVSIGCRIGVVESLSGEDNVAVLRRASAALVEARLSDQSSVRATGADLTSAALFDASLEADLRQALAADEIELLYQPQVEISSGSVVGVEALARWHHPVHGSLGATTLFAVAERSDYLQRLSQHVQRKALEQAVAWPDSLAGLRLSINLTASDIAAPRFAETLLDLVARSGFARTLLTVEIVENGLIDDLETAASVFASLRANGIRVAIDDFGTGYSSLAWLKALPLDYLKIDKGLAQDIAGTTRDRVVVRGVIDMARSLGLAVVAEGVETEEQLALLAAEGCNYYQGFLFAEPLTIEALVERLA